MSHVSYALPDLLNGVSQQPASLRQASQVEHQVNMYSDVVNGLSKRNNTEHLTKITDSTSSNIATHIINRDSSEQYILALADGVIRVFDLEGNEKTVVDTGASAYLSGASKEDVRFTTIGDTTFIVNRKKVVQESTEKTASQAFKALVNIQQGNYSRTYAIYLDNAFAGHYETKSSEKAENEDSIVPETIATGLYTIVSSYINTTGFPYNIERKGASLLIYKDDGSEFEIKVEDDFNGHAVSVATDTIRNFTDLPSNAWEDHKIKVTGDASEEADDYYVQYEEHTQSTGTWKECVAPDSVYKLDPSTMPIRLNSLSDGTFSLEYTSWDERISGDADSNEASSFVGNSISDIFFHKDRLGFISDESIVFSEQGSYFNFYQVSMLQLVDTDRIDASTNHQKVSKLQHVIPFAGKLVAFSDQTQFLIDDNGLLTPSSISISPLTEYESSKLVKPETVGNSLFFVSDSERYSQVHEFYGFDEQNTPVPTQTTQHVPHYIPTNVRKLTGSTTRNLLFVLSDDSPDEVFVYAFYTSGNQRVVSSWSKWTFGQSGTASYYVNGCKDSYLTKNGLKILDIEVLEDQLYMIIQYSDGVYLEKLDLDTASDDLEYPVNIHLDRRIKTDVCQLTYDAANDATEVILPYEDSRELDFVTVDANGDLSLTPTLEKVSDSFYKISGDLTTTEDTYLFGFIYDGLVKLSEQFIKDENKPILHSTFRIQKMRTRCSDTAHFKVLVNPEHADAHFYSFGTGSGVEALDQTITIPVYSLTNEVSIYFYNNSHTPFTLNTVEFDGLLNSKSITRI